jgi:hypothetical protein
MMKRSLGQQIFFAIFGTFGRYVTNLRGTFVENVKKVQNQPTLLYSIFEKDYETHSVLLFRIIFKIGVKVLMTKIISVVPMRSKEFKGQRRKPVKDKKTNSAKAASSPCPTYLRSC